MNIFSRKKNSYLTIIEPASSSGTFRLTGCLILLSALLLTSWKTILQGSFFVEDALLFSRYYGGLRPFSDVFEPHFNQTYVTLLSNFFAWLYAFADVRLQPYLYQLTGFFFGFFASCFLFFPG